MYGCGEQEVGVATGCGCKEVPYRKKYWREKYLAK